jgi:DNA-binding CsgD family transcriptional regulator
MRVDHETAAERVARLSDGQRECLRLVGRLQTSKAIAAKLGISPHSVDDRIRRALQTLGVQGRAEAAQLVLEFGADSPQRLIHQSSRLAPDVGSFDKEASLDGATPFSDGVRNELAEGQAAYFAPGLQIETSERWSFWEGLLAEHDLPVWGRLAVILGVALAGVVLAALLVSLAEGLSRLA